MSVSMSSIPPIEPFATEAPQLTQVRVPLERAAEAFSTRDENGRIPIVVICEREIRVLSSLLMAAGLVIVAGIFADTLFRTSLLTPLGIVAGLLLVALVAFNASRVRIYEGMNALLVRAGRYTRTIGSGFYLLPPWIAVTHLVTRREIPFTVPIEDAPTKDNVRALVNTLITFTITEPHRFVFNISADDFDLVLHAACQHEMRRMIRAIMSDQINDLPRFDLTQLRQLLSEQMEAFGIIIRKVSITFAQPPADFVQSQQGRELAVFQQKELEERQALAVQRQENANDLALEREIARVARESQVIQAQMKKEEARRELVTLEASVAERRLALLEERLRKFPNAVKWERFIEQLAVMRALAGNARTILQLGDSDEILRAVLLQESMSPAAAPHDANNSQTSEEKAKNRAP